MLRCEPRLADSLPPDSGHRVPLAEPGAGGVHLVEPSRAERSADLGDQVDLFVPQHRPRPEANPAPQALGRPAARAVQNSVEEPTERRAFCVAI